MRINYDPKEDAMYIRLSETPYSNSEEVQEGIILDRDTKGAITGIEFLKVSQKIPNLDTTDIQFEVGKGRK